MKRSACAVAALLMIWPELSPGQPVPTALPADPTTQDFVTQAARMAMIDLSAAKEAEQKSADPTYRSYAQDVVTDETKKGTERSGQEYVNPLLVLSGEEYAKMSFDGLLHRLEEAIRSGPRVVAEFLDSEGQSHVFTEEDE